MYDERQQGIIDIRDNLIKRIGIARDRAIRGKQNEERAEKYRIRLEELNKSIKELKICAHHLHDVHMNIQSYAQNHQDAAKEILNLAIMSAGQMVPDAGTKGIHLNTDKSGNTYVLNENGQNINLREGGGYRAVLGALLKYACLKAQPDALQFMLYDEYFFTLSDTTTQAMKDIFLAMKKDCTIVCIEQRQNAMDGILDAEYTFKKDDLGNTTVTKTL